MAVTPGNLNVAEKTQNMSVNECFQSHSTVLQGQPFGGVPTVLFLNIVLWVLIVLVYSFLRKAAWDYGRLALLIHNDRNEDLINKCGNDARIYIMFQYHLIIFVLILCIPSLGIILPINYTGTVLDRNSHFGRTTIVNVSTE
ncbi:Transmembrane protein 63C [Pteropus alecto]|uniref:Transmembrane protein 63C n=1 Tax=Pteropus alecto TaxID=9402 RepID=L5JP01_PTEAL|nr:Transmembrane protein 63C [Pteropus alecto]